MLSLLAACGGNSSPTTSSGQGAAAPNASPRPAGLPANWSELAIRAADATLQTCAQSTSLSPSTCPQTLAGVGGPGGGGPSTSNEHWTLLNGPLQHPLAVPGQAGQVDVYGLFQMDVSYVESGFSIRPFLLYDGGVAHATMTWDGTSFQSVQYNPTDNNWAPNVTPPVFTRPSQVTDAEVLAAVQAGFHDCVTLPAPQSGTATIPNCPQEFTYPEVSGVTAAQWVLTDDPMQGALPSFDPAHGNFAVTGNYSMNLNYDVSTPGDPYAAANGSHTGQSTASYNATLSWDGQKLTLVDIAPS